MPISIPSQSGLRDVFSCSAPWNPYQNRSPQPARTKYQARTELYPAWSAVDDAKNKASQLSDAAVKEFEKASTQAQAKTGKIELYSAKYYAACTWGGLMACVCRHGTTDLHRGLTEIGPYPYCRDTP